MTTDPKALIERLESTGETLRADGCHLEADSCYDAIQALRDLTAENERLKALGDGLAEAAGFRRGVEAAAKVATSFLVGDPHNGVPLRSPMPHEIAGRILALLETQETRHD